MISTTELSIATLEDGIRRAWYGRQHRSTTSRRGPFLFATERVYHTFTVSCRLDLEIVPRDPSDEEPELYRV